MMTRLLDGQRERFFLLDSPSSLPLPPSGSICLVSGSITAPGKAPRLYAKISRERLERYAQGHGYEVRYFEESLEPKAPLIWQKIFFMQKLLETEDFQVLVWVDDDIYITNLEMKIEEFLSLSEKPLILAEDIPKFPHNFINTGLFILRKTPETHEILKEMLVLRTTLCQGYYNENPFHEQTILTYLLVTKYPEVGVVLRKGRLQSFSKDESWQEGDFALHLAGESVEERNRRMQELQDVYK